MKTKIIAIYSIFIGISVISMWGVILSGQVVPEGPIEMSFHLFSEFLMAVLCIVSGILMLKRKAVGRLLNIAGLSMVIYSVLNAAGYYGEKGETPMLVMFGVLFVFTTGFLIATIRNSSA